MLIRVSPDALRNAASRQSDILSGVSDDVAKLDDIGNQLVDAWSGAAGASAYNAMGAVQKGIARTIDDSSKIISKLIDIANAFENVDNGEFAFELKFPGGLLPMPQLQAFAFSMSGMIKIDPDRVRDIAEQCRVVMTSISERTDTFATSVTELANDWEGKSYLKYNDEAQDIVRALREYEDRIAEFVARIVNAANRYEEIDNSL